MIKEMVQVREKQKEASLEKIKLRIEEDQIDKQRLIQSYVQTVEHEKALSCVLLLFSESLRKTIEKSLRS